MLSATRGGEEQPMTYVIAEPCVDVMDRSCIEVCPVDCIQFEEGTDRKLHIDADECIDCGSCEHECAQNAIYAAGDLPRQWGDYARVDVTWFKDRAAARAMLAALRPG
jgi:NAD-dependent dihydropyrimidine dehydrogenase PreA subunit